MKTFKLWLAILILGSAGVVRAEGNDPDLFSLTYFQFYGTPVQPQAFAKSTQDGLGLEVLAEMNPSAYLSVGLEFETVTFYNSSNFSLSVFGLETRFFASPNTKSPFAPYLYAGAGLGSSGAGNQVKAGLGSRANLGGPVFLDFAVGSNWFDSGFQYVNFRGGLSLSFDLPKGENKPAPSPTPKAAAVTETPTAAPVTMTDPKAPTWTPTPSSPTPTATVESIGEPTATVAPEVKASLMKKYYKIGMKAYDKKDFPTAIENLKLALLEEEPTVAYYYYAEANATLGVIYHFHSKAKDHNALALKYYKRALKIDPDTKSAKKFVKLLEPKSKAKKTKAKPKAKPRVKSAAKSAEKPKAEPKPTAEPVGESDL
jgi:hypothetical protein